MAEDAKSQGWWHTLPGVLTALAAGVTATSGLIAALYQAGMVGKKDQATAIVAAVPVEHKAGAAPPPAVAPSAPAPAPAVERPIEMPDGTSVTMHSGTGQKFRYTIVSAQRAPESPQKQLLRFRVRVWTNAPGGVVFWGDSFRLKIGELSLKPVNQLNELAAQDETKEENVEFEIDASVQEAVLAINVGGVTFDGNTKELRLKFV
ncbi:hypothetical protein [Rhizobacter sp. LjRoot28]|jgi:hypothetical protein|uniref:hypothetical protein n=1 Tax=Rhizobacter sp. LjRoot28 TaxID=3342309 RepID=UPI003ECC5FA3